MSTFLARTVHSACFVCRIRRVANSSSEFVFIYGGKPTSSLRNFHPKNYGAHPSTHPYFQSRWNMGIFWNCTKMSKFFESFTVKSHTKRFSFRKSPRCPGTLSATASLCLTARWERCAIWCSRSSSCQGCEKGRRIPESHWYMQCVGYFFHPDLNSQKQEKKQGFSMINKVQESKSEKN